MGSRGGWSPEQNKPFRRSEGGPQKPELSWAQEWGRRTMLSELVEKDE